MQSREGIQSNEDRSQNAYENRSGGSTASDHMALPGGPGMLGASGGAPVPGGVEPREESAQAGVGSPHDRAEINGAVPSDTIGTPLASANAETTLGGGSFGSQSDEAENGATGGRE